MRHAPLFEFGKENILFLGMMAPVHESSEEINQLLQISRSIGGSRHKFDLNFIKDFKG